MTWHKLIGSCCFTFKWLASIHLRVVMIELVLWFMKYSVHLHLMKKSILDILRGIFFVCFTEAGRSQNIFIGVVRLGLQNLL